MIKVDELMIDPDFSVPYEIHRATGQWKAGDFVLNEPTVIKVFAPVQPATVRELDQMPEGDRNRGIVKFFVRMPEQLYITQDNGPANIAQVSDTTVWNGSVYKIIQVMPWNASGWMRGFGYRIGAANGNN